MYTSANELHSLLDESLFYLEAQNLEKKNEFHNIGNQAHSWECAGHGVHHKGRPERGYSSKVRQQCHGGNRTPLNSLAEGSAGLSSKKSSKTPLQRVLQAWTLWLPLLPGRTSRSSCTVLRVSISACKQVILIHFQSFIQIIRSCKCGLVTKMPCLRPMLSLIPSALICTAKWWLSLRGRSSPRNTFTCHKNLFLPSKKIFHAVAAFTCC